MNFYRDNAAPEYDGNGISRQEMLPGIYGGGAVFCRVHLRAGAQWSPELYADRQTVVVFGKGKGYVTDPVAAHCVEELSCYFPNFDKAPYTVTATEEMELLFFVIELNKWDWDIINDTNARLPFFRTMKQFVGYHDSRNILENTKAYNVLMIKQYGRILMDVIKAEKGGGTAVQTNREAAQWLYFLCEAELTLAGERRSVSAGEFVYVPAGEERALSGGEKGLFVLRLSHFVRSYDFCRGAAAPAMKDMGHVSDQRLFYQAAEKIEVRYDGSGFFMTELLAGSYTNGIRNFKGFLKAGCEVSPELYADKGVLIMLGKGNGYISSSSGMNRFNDRIAFYMPDFDREPYTIHAYEDMEFIFSVIELTDYDRRVLDNWHVELPYYISLRDAIKYNQWCKGPGTTSWWVLRPCMFGRVICGVVEARNDGTRETAHPSVEQWNYCLKGADFSVSVDDEPVVRHREGDFSYIPAGYDHCLTAEGDEYTFYVWYEHFTPREDHFYVTPVNEEYKEQVMKTSADMKR